MESPDPSTLMCDPLIDNDKVISVSMGQHREVMGKIQELIVAVHGINAGVVTVIYLGLVSYFFYIDKVTDWVWIFMTLAGMTQFLGEKILKNALRLSRQNNE